MHTKRIHSRQRISSETSCRKSQRQAERIQANRFTLKQRARADLTLALFVSLRGVIKNTKRLSGSGPSEKRAYSSFIWKTWAGGGSERTTHTLNTHTHTDTATPADLICPGTLPYGSNRLQLRPLGYCVRQQLLQTSFITFICLCAHMYK